MTSLSIGGGSYKGLAFLGALEYLYSKNYLNLIDNVHGISIGGIIVVLFVMGYTPTEIFKIFLRVDFNDLWDLNFKNLENKYSLLNDTLFEKYVKGIIEKKEDINISVKDFSDKYKIKVNIYAVSLKNEN